MVDTSGHLLHKYEKKNLYTKTKLHINKTGIRCEEINTELTIFQLLQFLESVKSTISVEKCTL